MADSPFTVFFGSSTESLEYAEQLAGWIEGPGTRVVLWNTPEAFPAGHYTLDRLIQLTRTCHAAVFVFGEDDKVWYRESVDSQARDNVLLEYGLFASRIGIRNTLICRIARSRIAADLHGVTLVNYHADRKLDAKQRVTHWFSLCRADTEASCLRLEANRPKCEHVARHLLSDEIKERLRSISGWSVMARPDVNSLSIQNLIQKVYEFRTFPDALDFMSSAVAEIERLNHYPEWENVYSTVTVRITTWGVGSRITELDVQLAQALDVMYAAHSGRAGAAVH